MFSDNDKNHLLKAFTEVLIDAKGKGPKNIYIKYFENEIHIVMNGIITTFERYLINNFGGEAIETLTSFYERDCKNVEKSFLNIINNDFKFKFYELESDLIEDEFYFKMKIIK